MAFSKAWITQPGATALGGPNASVPADEDLYLDIPKADNTACDLVRRHDMEMILETVRTYLGKALQLPVEKIFGVATFEPG